MAVKYVEMPMHLSHGDPAHRDTNDEFLVRPTKNFLESVAFQRVAATVAGCELHALITKLKNSAEDSELINVDNSFDSSRVADQLVNQKTC